MTRKIMVTGATRGIGRALTELLLSRGDQVLAVGRNAEALKTLGCDYVVLDLSQPDTFAAAIEGIDPVDAVVHNAGVAFGGRLDATTVSEWNRQLTINVIAPAELTRLLLPELRRKRGQVVLVNSGVGLSASALFGTYSATKHALKAFADTLRAEEHENGVRVATVYPGKVDTEMQQQIRREIGADYPAETMTAETVALAIEHVLNTPRDAVVHDLRVAPSSLSTRDLWVVNAFARNGINAA